MPGRLYIKSHRPLPEQVLTAGGTIRLVNSSRIRRGRVVNARVPREAFPGIQAVE